MQRFRVSIQGRLWSLAPEYFAKEDVTYRRGQKEKHKLRSDRQPSQNKFRYDPVAFIVGLIIFSGSVPILSPS